MSRRRKLLLALGAAFGALILTTWIYHWHLKSINEAYLAELAARGEPLTLAQVVPPAVPPAENSAETFLRAADLLAADTSLLQTNNVYAMQMAAPGKALVCSQQSESAGSSSTNSWAAVARARAQNQPALELLQQLNDHPRLHFRINYESGVADLNFTNLHLVELRKSVHFLSAASVIALHEGDVAAAVQNQRTMLVLVNAMQDQRLVISELVRMAMLHSALGSCWEILQTPGVAESQLAALQHDWERLEFIQALQNALAMERMAGEISLTQWRGSATSLRQYLGLGKNARLSMGVPEEPETLLAKTVTSAKVFLWRFWWSYPDELRALKGYQALLGASRFTVTNTAFLPAITHQQAALDELQISQLSDSFSTLLFGDTDFHSMLSQSIVTLSGMINKVMTAETARQMTVTAIALQRFKLAHGRFPDHLADLAPEFLAVVPPDPVAGRPLRYRLQADGNFLLYSIGANGVDDGGNPAHAGPGDSKTFYWLDHYALDWVWPQPVAR